MKYYNFLDKPFKAIQLMELYNDAGWWAERTEQEIEEMLKSVIAIGVWDDDRLVGFARAITDGKFRAYIEDVVVHSEFQKSGIGKQLISKIMSELTHIDVVSLFCEEHLVPFYQSNSFKRSKSQFVLHRKK
ncbi:GNAT family N-acetyltransferase [Bacillus sp. CGMCC 1.16607]|uniref:GNAT family N-acetyltransferase n=1 Tax=Bacillus sp. CGMCC 1.16607 TaxID=3351842 RepID=UPI00362DFFF9